MFRLKVFRSLLFLCLLSSCYLGGIKLNYAPTYEEDKPTVVRLLFRKDDLLLGKVRDRCTLIEGSNPQQAVVEGDAYRLVVRYNKLTEEQIKSLKHDLELMLERIDMEVENE